MDINLVLKIGGIGLIISVVCQILSKSGRDEQAMLVSVAGMIIVLMMLVEQISELISIIRSTFGIG